MGTETTNTVVVGVTGAGENTSALKYAVHYAHRHGSTVQLVHVLHQAMPPPPPSTILTYHDFKEIGEQFVADAKGELQGIAELMGVEVACTTKVLQGSPAHQLRDAAADARLLVTQHRHVGRLGRFFTGSTTIRLAAHAHCPVVSVPGDWSLSTTPGRVTVGIHERGGPPEVMTAAFEAAADLGAMLQVLHAWRIDSMYADVIEDRVDDDWRARAIEHLRPGVEEARASHPSVEYDISIEHAWPEEALKRAAETSDLLVIGRHGSVPLEPEHLGYLARMLIREAPCPVMVVPPAHQPARSGATAT